MEGRITVMFIGGYEPCSLSDYPGEVACVLFTQGCNFRCPWCHNKGLWPFVALSERGEIDRWLEVLQYRIDRTPNQCYVVITGGEPTVRPELMPFLKVLRERGFKVKLDTNGSNPDIISELCSDGLVSYIAMDIKAPLCDERKYNEACGTAVDMNAIHRSIGIIASGGLPYTFRTTMIPALALKDIVKIQLEMQNYNHKLQGYKEAKKWV
jgi:pyruvate formate lyase activating enzyme